jgi:hypothetical protein
VSTVRLTRLRHPFEGRPLEVLGRMRRHGAVELLVVLPDGSKRLVPASWTDLERSPGGTDAGGGLATLGSVADLLGLAVLVCDLSARGADGREQAARKSPCKEDDHAACPAQSAAGPGSGTTPVIIGQLPAPQVDAAVTLLAGLIAKAAGTTAAEAEAGDE